MSIAIAWPVPNAEEQAKYTTTELYKSATAEGTYELVAAVPINETVYVDEAGTTSDWYRVRYWNEATEASSDFTEPIQGLSGGDYCTVEDVRELLATYDLSELGEEAEVESRIARLIEVTRSQIEAECNRDFHLHYLDTVKIGGTGNERLVLEEVPILFVREVRSAGEVLKSEDLVVDGSLGLIVKKAGEFPVGVENVEVQVTWGYVTPPADIAYAHAKLVAAELLAQLQGESGGVESTKIGDYQVSYEAGGRFAQQVERFKSEAYRTLALYRSPALGW